MRYLCKPSRVILLLLLANSCRQPDSNNTEADFTGRWTNAGQPTHQVKFGADGSFFIFQDGKPLGNGQLGPLTYEVSWEQHDTMAIIRTKGLAEPFARYRLKKRGKQLILISMKEGEAWNDHIDEALVFLPTELESTKGLDACPGKMPRQQFLLPEGFTGPICIASGQYHPDSVYVWAMGYNQLGRKNLNGFFGKAVEGNVGMFGVDTLRRLQSLNCVDPN